jgi:hypothetical protein
MLEKGESMKRLKVLSLVMALGAVICLPGMAGAVTTVLKFDDISTSGGWAVLPTNYGGLTWSATGGTAPTQWEVLGNAQYRADYANTFDFPSNPNVVYNGEKGGAGATTSTIVSSATTFNFDGAYFGTFTSNNTTNYYGATSINVSGMRGGSEVYNQNITLTPGALSWSQLDMNNIDTLVFTATAGSLGKNFLMDNFTTSPVPIPGALLLFGSGLLGLVGIGRKRFKR